MKITVTGRVSVCDSDADEEITTPERLQSLNGLVYDEEVCSEYLDEEPLCDIGIVGGALKLLYDREAQELRVVTEYWAPRTLTENETQALADYTEGQWSDGIGEGPCFEKYERMQGVSINLSPGRGGLQVEQVDDGLPVSPPPSILKAARKGDCQAIRQALDSGEDIESRQWGMTPLVLAVLYGHVEAALCLIERGASIDSRDKMGTTPLMTCAVSNRIVDVDSARVARKMLESGARVDDECEGWTALMYAKNRKKSELQRILIEYGANPTKGD